jgi:hypothetical protein
MLDHPCTAGYCHIARRPLSQGARWHNVVTRDYAVERRHDKLLATIAENVPEIVHEPLRAPLTAQVLDAAVADSAKR